MTFTSDNKITDEFNIFLYQYVDIFISIASVLQVKLANEYIIYGRFGETKCFIKIVGATASIKMLIKGNQHRTSKGRLVVTTWSSEIANLNSYTPYWRSPMFTVHRYY